MAIIDADQIKRIMKLDTLSEIGQVEALLKSIYNVNRLRILHFLADRVASVNEIANALDLPMSTTALYIEALEEAKLIQTELEPASRGQRKVCTRLYDQILLDFPLNGQPTRGTFIELNMPVGAFVDCMVRPTCGMLGNDGPVGMLDDPSSFYELDRLQAQLVWFTKGYVEYRFPNRIPPNLPVQHLHISMEICSEAPLHNLHWPSDITLWINNVETGTWTSPADFGGEAGKLTPAWWTTRNTQYGLLKMWHVNHEESRIDGARLSNITLADLNLGNHPYISVKIGVKEDATHVGGINLFGSGFGNYPQDIVLHIGFGSTTQPSRERT